MAISFDTSAELEAFCKTFVLRENIVSTQPNQSSQKPQASHSTRMKNDRLQSKKSPTAQTVSKSKKPSENSLVSQIKATIDGFIASKTAFVAKDIYIQLLQNNPTVKQATVLSMASLILNSQYQYLKSEPRPSKGPKPSRLFLP